MRATSGVSAPKYLVVRMYSDMEAQSIPVSQVDVSNEDDKSDKDEI